MIRSQVLFISTKSEGGVVAFTTDDGSSWNKLETTLLNQFGKEHFLLDMTQITMDSNQNWWVANYNAEGECHLYKIPQDGVGSEIQVPVLAQGGDGGWMTKYVNGLYAGNDNTILLELVNGPKKEYIQIDAETGNITGSFSPPGFPACMGYQNGNVYIVPSESNNLEVYAANNGKISVTHTLPIEGGILDSLRGVTISPDESLCMIRPVGIEKIALGGSLIQTIVDNRAFAFASADFRISSFTTTKDNCFWVSCNVRGANRVYRYVFDEKAPLHTGKSLYVWAMDDTVLLREALSVFAQDNPDYDILVEYGHSKDNSGQTDQDIIRTLNTQLLAEDGPDVLILDGLPIQAMIQQGMLADLSGIIDKSQYYDNILSCYAVEGKDYAYPAAFRLPVLIKKEGITGPSIANVTTMPALQEILEDPSHIYFGGYSHLFATLYAAYAPTIFPGGNSVDEDALREFLETTKAIVAGHGLSQMEIDPITAGFEIGADDGTGSISMVMPPSLTMYEKYGYTADVLMSFSNYSFLDLANSIPILEPLPGNVFLPTCVAGVPAGAHDIEGGKEFVKILLESQDENTACFMELPGFLVKKNIELQSATRNYERMMAEENEFGVIPDNPSLIDWNHLIAKYTAPGNMDAILQVKLYEQAKMLYCGGIDVEEAVRGVLKNTQLYFAERK